MDKDDKEFGFIERRIVLGLIINTRYVQTIREVWNPLFIQASSAKLVASWCLDYYDQYKKAPKSHIEDIFMEKMSEGLQDDSDKAAFIESVIDHLHDEYKHKKFNLDYLVEETKKYFDRRALEIHCSEIQGALDTNNLGHARSIAESFSSPVSLDTNIIDPFSEEARKNWKAAFKQHSDILITKMKPGLKSFFGYNLIRGGFVAFMGPEKVGKSHLLLDLAMRGVQSGCNVAFFQAGDMTENDQIRRIGLKVTGRSDREKYCGPCYVPVRDCLWNQNGTCKNVDRRSPKHQSAVCSKNIPTKELMKIYRDNPEHVPCFLLGCKRFARAIWLKREKPVDILTWKEAYKASTKWMERYRGRFMLFTYPNETLTVNEVKSKLDYAERKFGFVTDIGVLDYADLLAADRDVKQYDFRNQQNKTWQRLRGLSESKRMLLLTATLSSAKSYGKSWIIRSDFSEDKRKYAHVTGIFGLNQTDDERDIGILRINDVLMREDKFSKNNYATILQCLQRGRFCIECF